MIFRLLLLLFYATDTRSAAVTAYCPCNKCCGRWSTASITSAGTKPTAGRTAAGPRNIPLGTYVNIEGIGIRIVEDRTARRYDGTWEVYYATHKRAKEFGKRNLVVTILP